MLLCICAQVLQTAMITAVQRATLSPEPHHPLANACLPGCIQYGQAPVASCTALLMAGLLQKSKTCLALSFRFSHGGLGVPGFGCKTSLVQGT